MRVAVGESRDTEVDNLRLAGFVHHDVARFKIAVNQTALVRMMHGFADLGHQLQALTRGQMLLLGELAEPPAADKLHGKIRLRPKAGIGCTDFVNLRDSGMLQASQGLRFLLESPQEFGTGQPRLDDLEGYRPAWVFLLSFIDGPHAAFAEQPIDL